MGSKPVVIVCPLCQPGPYSYAGTILARVCKACRELLKESR